MEALRTTGANARGYSLRARVDTRHNVVRRVAAKDRRHPFGGAQQQTIFRARAAIADSGSQASEDAYNKAMKEYSKTPFEYRHELGLYYHSILPNLIVGTQPTTPADIDRLADVEGVTCIFNTQQDKDMVYWNVDFEAVKERIQEKGLTLARQPFPDFDAHGLRRGLPEAAWAMNQLIAEGHVVYCHCTAGMGRSPGVAIGYLYWFPNNFSDLDDAYDFLTKIRPCGPKKEAIRAATVDVLNAAQHNLDAVELVDSEEPQGTELTLNERVTLRNTLKRIFQEQKEEEEVVREDGPFSILFRFLSGEMQK